MPAFTSSPRWCASAVLPSLVVCRSSLKVCGPFVSDVSNCSRFLLAMDPKMKTMSSLDFVRIFQVGSLSGRLKMDLHPLLTVGCSLLSVSSLAER